MVDKENFTKQVLLRVSPTMHQELWEIAQREGRPLTNLVRLMLTKALDKRREKERGERQA